MPRLYAKFSFGFPGAVHSHRFEPVSLAMNFFDSEIDFEKYGKGVVGAVHGIRTPDPLITNEVLYQLS